MGVVGEECTDHVIAYGNCIVVGVIGEESTDHELRTASCVGGVGPAHFRVQRRSSLHIVR
jgi:hypothetical protein